MTSTDDFDMSILNHIIIFAFILFSLHCIAMPKDLHFTTVFFSSFFFNA